MRKTFLACLVVAAAFALSACSTLQGLPSVQDEGQSPRRTTTAAIEQVVVPTFDKLTFAAKAGALPDNFLDDVGQFSGRADTIATAYLDATAACVVIDGSLQTDPATGRACERSAVKRAFGDLSNLVAEAVNRAGPGTSTGRGLLVASLILDRQLRPSSGDVWSGYEKRPDLTLEEFNASRAALRASFDGFVAAAAAALKAPAK